MNCLFFFFFIKRPAEEVEVEAETAGLGGF